MALSRLINFLSGATRLAKLDPATAFPDKRRTGAMSSNPRPCRQGRRRRGAIFGVWISHELYLHPDTAEPDGRSIMMTFVLAPLMMLAAGMLAGVSWAGLFMPGTFFSSSTGAHWMKLCGTKGATSPD